MTSLSEVELASLDSGPACDRSAVLRSLLEVPGSWPLFQPPLSALCQLHARAVPSLSCLFGCARARRCQADGRSRGTQSVLRSQDPGTSSSRLHSRCPCTS